MKKEPLFIFATHQEAEDTIKLLEGKAPIYISGVGKVNMALECAKLLTIPFVYNHYKVILLGTCAAFVNLNTKIGDLIKFENFVECDMNATGLGYKIGEVPFQKESNQISFGEGKKIMTGDKFINDEQEFGKLCVDFRAGYLDMEAFVAAKFCKKYQIEFECWKYVTDNGDEKQNWNETVKDASKKLSEIARNIYETN